MAGKKTTEVSRIRIFVRCWLRIQFYFQHFKMFSFQFWCLGVNDGAETLLLWIGGISFVILGLRSVLSTGCHILSAVPSPTITLLGFSNPRLGCCLLSPTVFLLNMTKGEEYSGVLTLRHTEDPPWSFVSLRWQGHRGQKENSIGLSVGVVDWLPR